MRARRADPFSGPGKPSVHAGPLDTLAAEMLARSPWFPRAGLAREAVAVVDTLPLGPSMLMWVETRALQGRLALLAVRRQGGQLEAMSTAAAVLSLTARARWSTAAGGTVQWTGPRAGASFREQVGTTATNDVARIALAGTPALLKAYRLVGDGQDEARVLAAAAPSGLVPRVLVEVGYRHAAAADLVPLALVTEAVAGQTLDVPLRHSIERAWRAGRSELCPSDQDLLRRVRRAVRSLQRRLLAGDKPLRHPLVARLPHLLADIDVVRSLSPRCPAAHRLLDGVVGRAAALCTSGELITVGGHGDLHLSHVLVDRDKVCFVDLGSGAVPPSDDFAALHRAVDCLCLDLQVALVAARAEGEHEVAAALRAAALGGDPRRHPADLWSPLVRTEAGADGARVAERWRAGVVAELVGPRPGAADAFAYVARLLHDLRYHIERERTYYADLAWWHLARSLTADAPGPIGKLSP